jgi:hypothetical protein
MRTSIITVVTGLLFACTGPTESPDDLRGAPVYDLVIVTPTGVYDSAGSAIPSGRALVSPDVTYETDDGLTVYLNGRPATAGGTGVLDVGGVTELVCGCIIDGSGQTIDCGPQSITCNSCCIDAGGEWAHKLKLGPA